MKETTDLSKEIVLEDIISNSVKIPGVKVNRNKFLAEQFSSSTVNIDDIIKLGPVQAGVTEEEIVNTASKLIIKRTGQSSIASFVTGIPGGLAMAATIPADILQFFGMALRLAQELSYLYGAQDLWVDGKVDDERVKSQLILYCGVMFGVSGAVSGIRVLSTQLAKTTLKQIPQKALTKTFWYPIIKQICKAVGVKVTKSTFAKGLSKAIPIVGGVVSGSLNFASMLPMANRLNDALIKATFNYSQEELYQDIEFIENLAQASDTESSNETLSNINTEVKEKISSEINSAKKNFSILASKVIKKKEIDQSNNQDDPFEKVKKLKELLDIGAITQDEFDLKKKELLNLQ